METRARFTRMQDGTAEEFALIEAAETAYASTLPARVLEAVRALETGGAQGYAISRLEHSLQSATRAERDGRPVDYVVAALVHDIGDSLAPYSHGSYAASVLRPFVSEELCWIVSHHPLFQMFYYGPHMGGDKNARDRFRGHPWFDATVEFCERYDENCFDPAYEWLPLAHFAPCGAGGIQPRAFVPISGSRCTTVHVSVSCLEVVGRFADSSRCRERLPVRRRMATCEAGQCRQMPRGGRP